MINIVYSGDKNAFKGILLSVMSMIKYCDKSIKIYILTMDVVVENKQFYMVSDKQIELLKKVVKSKNSESNVIKVDVKFLYEKHLANSKNKATCYTPYTLLRLLLDLIENMPKKLIYLDCDTMLAGDINKLYSEDIEGYEYGAVIDYMGKFWVAKDYTNNGVLLLNLGEIKKSGLLVNSRYLVNNTKMFMPDQTAMYRSFKKRKILDKKYNEQRDIKENTIVKHFCKGIKWMPFFHIYNIKQWDIINVHKKLKIFMFDDVFDGYKMLINKYDFIL